VRFKVTIVALTCLFMLGACTFSIVRAQSSEDVVPALSAISDARSRIVTCFEAAQLAESAGANISSLTMKINDAGSLLSIAEVAFSSGDFLGAQRLALESRTLLSDFESAADSLRVAATQAANMDFWVNIVGSCVGTIVVIVVSVFVWTLLKKKYSSKEVQRFESVTV
jgi:hypothetical protein